MCASWSQSIAIQAKFWALVPKDELSEGTVFDPVNGFRGKHPTCAFKNGSIVRFKTTKQDALDLAGATIDFVLFDEPPHSERVYAEVVKRVQDKQGKILLTLTPINAETKWLKELCEQGAIKDLHYRLLPEYLIPVGATEPRILSDGTPCDETWIQSLRDSSLPHEIPVVIDGEWEFRQVNGVFRDTFSRVTHVSDIIPNEEVRLQIGFDWGTGSKFSQYAVLVAITSDYRIHILDEYVPPGPTTVHQDALGVKHILDRNHIKWSDLDNAYGDRVHMSGTLQQKSNKDFSAQMERVLNIRAGTLQPIIQTVKRGEGRGAGSVHLGTKYIHNALIEKRLIINPRCTRLIESIDKWDGSDNEYKHQIDALRYALDNLIFNKQRRGYQQINII